MMDVLLYTPLISQMKPEDQPVFSQMLKDSINGTDNSAAVEQFLTERGLITDPTKQ
jgi:hypothetical protein